MKDEMLTVLEVSRFLKIPRSTLYKLVQEGTIPASKIGKHWRIRKRALNDWILENENNRKR